MNFLCLFSVLSHNIFLVFLSFRRVEIKIKIVAHKLDRFHMFSCVLDKVNPGVDVNTGTQMKASVTGFPLSTGNKSKGLAN